MLPVPAPQGFETHTAERLLINLRDATAHGDARNVSPPFNVTVGAEHLLAGLTFDCSELKKRKTVWSGTITGFSKRICGGSVSEPAKLYCDAIRRSEPHRRDGHQRDAASIKEVAA